MESRKLSTLLLLMIISLLRKVSMQTSLKYCCFILRMMLMPKKAVTAHQQTDAMKMESLREFTERVQSYRLEKTWSAMPQTTFYIWLSTVCRQKVFEEMLVRICLQMSVWFMATQLLQFWSAFALAQKSCLNSTPNQPRSVRQEQLYMQTFVLTMVPFLFLTQPFRSVS